MKVANTPQLKTQRPNPYIRFIFGFKVPPFQTATKLPTWSILGVFCFKLGSPKLHHDTTRLHQQAFLPPVARTHANALATEVMQHRMAQRHHLSKALAVSLLKNHYSNECFCRGKGRPFDLEVFCFLIRD